MRHAVTLVMDTSASPLRLGIEKEGRLFTLRKKGIKQEKLLFPALQKLLARAGAKLADIKQIFIIRGPGRFTGIRISLTFASMLKYLNDAQVKGATVFEVVAHQALHGGKFLRWKKENPTGVLAVVLHAFREEYFLQFFDNDNQGPLWLSREELLARLAAYPAPLWVAGSDKEFSSLESLLGKRYALAPAKDGRVQVQTLVKLNREEKFTQDALEPLYLKPARFELVKPV